MCPEQRQSHAQTLLGETYARREKWERFGPVCDHTPTPPAIVHPPYLSAYDDPILGPLMERMDEEEKKGEPPRMSLLY